MNGRARFLPITQLALTFTLHGCGGGSGSLDDPTITDEMDNNGNTDNPVNNTSGGYNSSEDRAVVNENNARDLAIGAASSMKQVLDEKDILFPMQGAANASKSYLAEQLMEVIYVTNHGYIDVTTEISFTLDCPNEHPGSKRLNFISAGQPSGIIEYICCEEYMIATNNGISNTYRL